MAERLIFGAALLAAITSLDQGATAGVRRDDVADSNYTALAAQPDFASVGKVFATGVGLGTGTLIDGQWILTAGHVLSFPNPTSVVFNINGSNYTANEWIPHPLWDANAGVNGNDIGLIHLSATLAGITPSVRYTDTSELGATATIVGYGQTGTGLTGQQGGTQGTKRAGNNVLDVLGGSAEASDNYLMVDFDNPNTAADNSWGSATPLPLEYAPAPGDSGGGAFINDGGVQKLAGVVSIGESGPITNPDGSPNADYGDYMGFTRVSVFNTWIDDQISARYWKTATNGSFDTPSKWDTGSAPGSSNIAVFNAAGAYLVSLASDVSNKRVRVRAGDVTLDLAGHQYSLSNTALDRSMVVGQILGDNAKLTFTGAGTINAVDASIAQLSGSTGQLAISGAGTALNLSGSIGIGGSPTVAGGTGTLTVNSGAIVQVAGTMKLWNSSSTLILNGGTLTAQPLDVGAGSVNVMADSSLGGVINLSGGSIGGNGVATMAGTVNWTGGILQGSGATVIAPGATLNISGASTKQYDNHTITNQGIVTWTGAGDLRSNATNSVVVFGNQTGALFDVRNDRFLSFNGSGSTNTFNNAGTFRKSAGTGTTTISWTFNNTGTVEVDSGTLSMFAAFDQTQSSARILLNGGTFSKSSTLAIGAGSIEGNGTISANVETSGVVSPGQSAGALTVNGSLTLQNGAQSVFELGGAQQGISFDHLDASGNIALGGDLVVSFLNGFQSSVSMADTFTLMSTTGATSTITGAFADVANDGRLSTADGYGSFAVHYGVDSTFNPKSVVLSNFLLSGDHDQNGVVDAADYVVWRKTDGAPAGYNAWRANFGRSVIVSAAALDLATVPEPSGRLLVFAALLILAATRATRDRTCRGCASAGKNSREPLSSLFVFNETY